MGAEDLPGTLRVLREIGSALSYLHDLGSVHGCISPETIWATPMGRLWIIGWQWALPSSDIPFGLAPDFRFMPVPHEWSGGVWTPTPQTDQWQLAATCFATLTGEMPPAIEAPPIQLLRPDCPQTIAVIIDRALNGNPEARYPTMAWMLRAVDRVVGGRTMTSLAGDEPGGRGAHKGGVGRRRAGCAHQRVARVAPALGAGR